MPSPLRSRTSLPGPPQHTEVAYLAGLLDRAGGYIASERAIGLKVVCGPTLRRWLVMRFGGVDSTRAWTLTRQADLAFLLPRLRAHTVARADELEALMALISHLQSRDSYHGDEEWRQRRQDLIDAVRASRPEPRGS